MTKTRKYRYSSIAPYIDVDAFEEAIGFEPLETDHRGNDIGYCPDIWGLHKNGDSTGKFAIHRDKRVYGCWVCGGGSLLSLVMELKSMDEDTALEWLAQFVGEEAVSDEAFEDEIEAILVAETRQKSVLPYFNKRVIESWAERWSETDFFEERGISKEVVTELRLGYNPEAHKRSKKGEEYTGPGIIIPHFWNDRLVGWQTRWLEDDRPKWVNKYTNTTDFPKEGTLYCFERVYLSKRPIVVVESGPTVAFLMSLGIPAVGTFGGSVTTEQVRLLRRFQQGVILARDNDGPGRKWLELDKKDRLKGKLPLTEQLERYVPVRVAAPVGDYDSGDDLGDLSDDPKLVQELVNDAYDWI